ncbi:hypothetical protein D3C76_843390 [compost metagenome]
MAAGPAVPPAGAQRRDQHHHRQPQLGPGTPQQVHQRSDPGSGRTRPAGQPRRFRLLQHGQHAGTDGHRRHGPVPRPAHDHSAGLAERRDHGRRPARVLRIQLAAHGAVGRPGGRGADRWSLRRLPARPQRSASGALGHHQERLHHPRLGNRRVGLQAGRRHRQGPRRPGPDPRGGHRDRPGPAHRRDRQPPEVAPPLQAVAAPERRAHPGQAGRRPRRGQLRQRPAQAVHEDVPGHLRGA